MRPHELKSPPGARRSRKRIGRGNASGQGTFAGKGLKGQKARSGNDLRPGFEGGQLAFIKRLPSRRGFKNRFRKEYSVVNLSTLIRLETNEITLETLRGQGIVKRNLPVKLLATGELSKKLTITVDRVSAAARAKIEKAGGSVTELEERGPRKVRDRSKKASPASVSDTAEETTDDTSVEAKTEEATDDGNESSSSAESTE
jgi:large subunit ribosomal protein L15